MNKLIEIDNYEQTGIYRQVDKYGQTEIDV